MNPAASSAWVKNECRFAPAAHIPLWHAYVLLLYLFMDRGQQVCLTVYPLSEKLGATSMKDCLLLLSAVFFYSITCAVCVCVCL